MNDQTTTSPENSPDASAGALAAPPDAPVNSYDLVPYSVHAFPQTQPAQLGVIATLFGLAPAPPARCRVLELGCGRGGNIIPMALASPNSQFVGVDLSRVQIEDARSVARELGLSNVEFHDISILDVGPEFGTFDYILTHGVFSWVPPAVRDKILAICRHNLAPQGVAYISYNTFPGWHARGAVREMLCYRTERFTDPADRVREARALLEFLAQSVSSGDGGYGTLVKQELALLKRTPDSYLLHEHLEDFNQPFYFHQFVQRAAAEGLQYLGEAQIGTMMPGRFGAEVEKTLRSLSADMLHMEQYMDFLRNRMFRQTLLCHSEVKLDYGLRPQSVREFYVASSAMPVDASAADETQFKARNGLQLSTRDPLMKAAMTHLSEMWPQAIAFQDLLAEARRRTGSAADGDRLSVRLLNCYVSGVVEFSLSPSPFVVDVSDRPVASPYARLRQRQGPVVVNMRLESVELGGPSGKLLALLDGTHSRSELIDAVWSSLAASAQQHTQAAEFVARALAAFGRLALLVA